MTGMKRTTHLTAFLSALFLFAASSHGAEPAASGAKSSLPPGEAGAKAALEKSSRHGEWVDIQAPGSNAPLRAYVVYPERKDKAPVVIVIQEIFGLTDWIRSVADQLAADGFIAIAPDLLSGMGPGGKGTEGFASRDDVTRAVRELKAPDVMARLDAVKAYGEKLPASNGKTGTVGFCWGGGMSFNYAVHQPGLGAAVVYYGTNPSKPEDLAKVKAPVLGQYGGNDNRVNSTIEPAANAMKQSGKTYVYTIHEGAGHGFLRQQDGQNGANMKATQAAWPATVQFLREHTK
jgi:carboxymethylenebutenolidase